MYVNNINEVIVIHWKTLSIVSQYFVTNRNIVA